MKGMALEYAFIIIIVVVVIVVGVAILRAFINPGNIPPTDQVVDVKYACVQYNETRVGLEDFKTLLYGFLTDQCRIFVGELKQTVSIDDLKGMVKEIDGSINVIALPSCEMPTIQAHNLYVYFNESLKRSKSFNITRKEIKNSDVLICQ